MSVSTATEVKATTLYHRSSGSDKIYRVAISKVAGGYLVDAWNGPREGSRTHRPQTPKPISLGDAEKMFAKLVEKKEKHRDTPYTVGPDLKESATYVPPENATGSIYLPQLLTALDDSETTVKLLRSENYVLEEKIDGERIIIVANSAGVVPYNRKGEVSGRVSRAITDDAVRMLKQFGPFTFDGEAVGEKYYAFDLLSLADEDLRLRSQRERRSRLDHGLTLFTRWRRESVLSLVPTFAEHDAKVRMLQKYFRDGAEGVVLKRWDATYQQGRARDQFKFKFKATGSFIVVKRNEKMSVRLGLLTEKNELVEVGNCTIRNAEMAKEIVDGSSIVEVEYLNVRRDGDLYQPVMLGVRQDLAWADCTFSQLRYRKESRV
jgi:bifunctional non-homologous end joining protein LigD